VPRRNADGPSAPVEALPDDELLSALALALRELDPVPAGVVETGKTALSWRTVDAELAELVADTEVETAGASRVRAPRILTFAADDTTLVLEVTEEQNGRRLLGQIVAPRRAGIEAAHRFGTVTVETDDLGRFRIEHFPAGPIRLSLRVPGKASTVITPWVNI
jgi:hypothetical protein